MGKSDTTAVIERCPACGQPIDTLSNGACALCGHVLVEPPVTSEDTTPYARFLAGGRGGWWAMARWVFAAGGTRLAFLALIRSSKASRRFARIGIGFAALSLALALAAHAGWRVSSQVRVGPDAPQTEPRGQGWYLLSQTAPRVFNETPRPDPTHLWWNPLASLVAAGCTLGMTALAATVLMLLLRGLTELCLRPEHRGDGRLSATIHYLWAWAAWLLPAGVAVAVRPVSLIGQLKREGSYPSEHVVYVVAAVIATVAVLLAWFTLVRSAATVPRASRGRLVAAYMFAAPLVTAAVVASSGLGLFRIVDVLNTALNLQW